MSFRGIHRSTQVLLILALALLATGALAEDKECSKERKHTKTISIELDDDDLILTRNCGDDSRVVMLNLEAVEDMVTDALEDVSDALEEMEDMQMEFHLGQDNKLSFADADSEWEIDLGQIAMQVESALREGFAEFETEEWTNHHSVYSDENELEDLQKELESLRREMKRLERQLEKRSSKED